ncbi:ubiquinone/menaquinone biosynthesis C-methylase UbiE [Methanofollis sp. W23]|uniref:class I SAM-dependent methyltransferase n=1 Tax=Methanofollis sp. W23 TaxID=2817849 RepID=UPI001AE59C41|nr:class I SAM-dependent methyltransferase [Methanofollis sp. W23]MBP2145143.1 ubiquinone/menaquinone biosynthesis C-methylase UbiE [Methanofollis sp. W23]
MGTPEREEAWERDYRHRGALWGGAVHDLPPLVPGARVLELGCGNGKTLSGLTGHGATVVGLDLARGAVALAARSTSAHLVVGDARRLPFPAGSFDTVCAFHLIGHLMRDDREEAAMECTRVLKEGGRLYFKEFSVMDMRAGKGEEVEPWTFRRGEGVLTHYFTEEEGTALFPSLAPCTVTTRRWALRVRGVDHPRAEIAAVFERRPHP